MKLYLVRHGEAITPNTDPSPPLSTKGRLDTIQMAEHLKLDAIDVWHSSKLRAIQTAELLMPNSKRIEKEGLKPNDPVDLMVTEIMGLEKDTMIVSHLPFLPSLFNALNVIGVEPFSFGNTTVVALERRDDFWCFLWVHSPKDFK